MYIPQGIAVEFNKNVQREITGNTTQYYQNTTKGFEFTDANFKIKAQSKIERKVRQVKKSATVIYLVCTVPIHLGVYIYEVI